MQDDMDNMSFESQVKKIFHGDTTVMSADTSVRSLDVILPIIDDLQNSFSEVVDCC